MTVDVSDFDRFADEMERVPDRVRDGIVTAIDEATGVGIRVAKAWAPVGETGDLRDGIEPLPKRGVSGQYGISGGFRSKAFYSWFLEAGTAHIAPRPFMTRGRDAAEPVFHDALERVIDRAVP